MEHIPNTKGSTAENYKSESRLIFETMQELGKHGTVFRTNSGSIRLASGKVFRGLPKGFSDILFIRSDGKPCFVECKIHPNKPSPEQLDFLNKMQKMQYLCGVAYNVYDALTICQILNHNYSL